MYVLRYFVCVLCLECFGFVCVMCLVTCGYCCVVMLCWVERELVNDFGCDSVNSVVWIFVF